MKNRNLLLPTTLIIFFTILGLVSCKKSVKKSYDRVDFSSMVSKTVTDEEEAIVGTYYSAFMERYDDGGVLSYEAEIVYRADNTNLCEGIAKFKIPLEIEEDDYYNEITLTYKRTAKATWHVENGYLIEKGIEYDLEYIDGTSLKPSDDFYDVDVLIKRYKEYFEMGIPQIRQEFMKKVRRKIVRIDDEGLVLRDEEGEEETYTRK